MNDAIKDIFGICGVEISKIEKSDSGFTNEVYFVDDKYVIKLCKNKKKEAKFEKELAFYNNVSLDFIPKLLWSGEYEGRKYLILNKLEGRPLYKTWHLMSDLEREGIVKRIATMLRSFHSQEYKWLPEKYVSDNWLDKWHKSFDINIRELDKRGYNTDRIKYFKENYLDRLFSQQVNGLIYNDAHFDNFLYDGSKLWLIDFDRVMYGSMDYEMLIMSLMTCKPYKFANEEDEMNAKEEDYINITGWLKKYYPKMFDFEYYEDRIYVYTFVYNLGNAYLYDDNDTIRTELSDFIEYFKL